MSTSALAARLRLNVKQIDALERGDLAALPSLIYVRGFLRGCARELKIDPAPLLEDLNRRAGVELPTLAQTDAGSFRLARFGDGSRPIIVIAILVLAIAGVIGTLVPRRGPAPGAATSAEREATPVLADPAPALAADKAPTAGPGGSTLPSPADASQVLGGAPGASALPPAIAPVLGQAAASASTSSAAPASTPTTTPIAPARPLAVPALTPPASGVAPPRAANATQPLVRAAPPTSRPPGDAGAAKPVAPVNAAASAAVALAAPVAAVAAPAMQGAPDLILRVNGASWVEVVQADGTSLLARICSAGTVQQIKGKPPYRVIVGNAPAVQAQFRGNPVDLSQYANVNGVARFTLE
jgi:cytoskeleton protein RodZ